jgi:uncharacterized protein YggE
MRCFKICLIALACVLVPLRLQAQQERARPDGRRSISVEGEAEVKVVPDRILLTLGIETSDKDLEKAKQLHDARTRAVIDAVRREGVELKDIQTDFLEIEPRWDLTPRPENFIGYFVRKTVVVTQRDVPKFEEVLSVALASGVNYVLGVQFQTSELRKHRDEARALAIKAAREKAVALADQLNQRVGNPIEISEVSNRWYSWYGRSWWGSRQGSQYQNVVQNVGGDAFPEDGVLSPGRISVTASVRVIFELQ